MPVALAPAPRLSDYSADLLQHQRSISFVRFLSLCYEQSRITRRGWPGVPDGLDTAFAARWPRDPCREEVTHSIRRFIEKTAIAPGTSSDASWAGPLAAIRPLVDAFLAYVRAASVLDKLAVVPVPFNSSLPAQTSGGTFGWVGEQHVKPIISLAFGSVVVGFAKAMGIIVVTDELLRLTTPGTEPFLRTALAKGVSEFVDAQFLGTAAPVANVSPGGIASGISPISPTGTTAAALQKDVAALLGAFFQANPNAMASALVMAPQYVAMLAGVSNSMTLTLTGGTYSGVPVVPSASAGTAIVAVDASAILVATGGIAIDSSTNAALQVDTAPSDPAVAASVVTSLWQENLVGLRAEYWISWTRGRTSAVKLISPAAYVPGT